MKKTYGKLLLYKLSEKYLEQSTLHGLITLFPETTVFQTKNPVPRVWYLSLWVGDYINPGSPQSNTNYCPCSWLSTGNKWKNPFAGNSWIWAGSFLFAG